MLPWKQRGTGKATKGTNLRDMLARLSRSETESKRDASNERQGMVSTGRDTSGSEDGGEASVSMLARYFSSSSDAGPSQVGPSTWNSPPEDETPEQDAVGPVAQSYAHMQWAEAQRQNEQSSMPSSGSGAAHSQQFADEIVSGIARKLAARQYVPKFDVTQAFPEEARELPASHAYAHGFEPAPRDERDEIEEQFTPPVSQAQLPEKQPNRASAIANWPTGEVRPSSTRRILFATAGGFSVALAAIAGVVMMNRAEAPPQRDSGANVRPTTPLPVERTQIVAAAPSPVIEIVAPAPPRTAPSAPNVSTYVASLGSVPPPTPAATARKALPTFRIDDIVVPAGSADVAFPVSLDPGGGTTENLRIVMTEVPGGVSLNHGVKARDGSWNLRPKDLEGLRVTIPPATSTTQVTVALVSDGVQVARLSPTISIEAPTDLKVSLGKNDNEEKARGLFEKGEARLGNGDVIGARMFFKKAADAGDAQAANAMGATYDPDLFSSMRVQGMRPDVEMARQWYRRAMELGSKDSLDRLDRLKSR